MSFLCIQIRPYGVVEDDFSYVSTTPEGGVIEEKLDNGLQNHIIAKKVKISRYNSHTDAWSCVGEVADKSKVDVYITESRCIVLCDSYDKGSSWYGAPISSLILTGISRAAAAARTKNKLLAGQIRHEWLSKVGYTRKKKWTEEESVYLYYSDNEKVLYRVCIWFNKDTDTAFIANEILHFACRYRLSMTDDKEDKEINFFNKYCTEEIQYNTEPNAISIVSFPTRYYAPYGKDYRPNTNDSKCCIEESGNTNIGNDELVIACQTTTAATPKSKYCGNCGNKININSVFCPECGNKIDS